MERRDVAETLDDLVATIVAEAQALHGEQPDDAPGQYLRGALNAFAAEIVNRVLPDDLVALAAVIRKAQAFGIDIGDPAERRDKAVSTPQALMSIRAENILVIGMILVAVAAVAVAKHYFALW